MDWHICNIIRYLRLTGIDFAILEGRTITPSNAIIIQITGISSGSSDVLAAASLTMTRV
jgi:hypothetical protein